MISRQNGVYVQFVRHMRPESMLAFTASTLPATRATSRTTLPPCSTILVRVPLRLLHSGSTWFFLMNYIADCTTCGDGLVLLLVVIIQLAVMVLLVFVSSCYWWSYKCSVLSVGCPKHGNTLLAFVALCSGKFIIIQNIISPTFACSDLVMGNLDSDTFFWWASTWIFSLIV